MQHPMAAQGLAVVLDPHGGGFGCAQGVDAEQVRQGTVVNRNGLGDLEEADQLEPVQALSPCLVLVDLRQSGVDDRVGRDQAVDVGESEESPNACIIVLTEDGIRPVSPRWRMYNSTCARWIPTSGSSRLVSHHANQRRSW
jgi:hypothetical protein